MRCANVLRCPLDNLNLLDSQRSAPSQQSPYIQVPVGPRTAVWRRRLPSTYDNAIRHGLSITQRQAAYIRMLVASVDADRPRQLPETADGRSRSV